MVRYIIEKLIGANQFLWNQQIHHRVHRNGLLSQLNPVRSFETQFSRSNLIITVLLPSDFQTNTF